MVVNLFIGNMQLFTYRLFLWSALYSVQSNNWSSTFILANITYLYGSAGKHVCSLGFTWMVAEKTKQMPICQSWKVLLDLLLRGTQALQQLSTEKLFMYNTLFQYSFSQSHFLTQLTGTSLLIQQFISLLLQLYIYLPIDKTWWC